MLSVLLVLGICLVFIAIITLVLIFKDRRKDNLKDLVDDPKILFEDKDNYKTMDNNINKNNILETKEEIKQEEIKLEQNINKDEINNINNVNNKVEEKIDEEII